MIERQPSRGALIEEIFNDIVIFVKYLYFLLLFEFSSLRFDCSQKKNKRKMVQLTDTVGVFLLLFIAAATIEEAFNVVVIFRKEEIGFAATDCA